MLISSDISGSRFQRRALSVVIKKVKEFKIQIVNFEGGKKTTGRCFIQPCCLHKTKRCSTRDDPIFHNEDIQIRNLGARNYFQTKSKPSNFIACFLKMCIPHTGIKNVEKKKIHCLKGA